VALRVRTIRARFDHHRGAAPLLRQTSWPRTIFFVLANLAGFIAISAFVQYLAVGKWLDFSYEGYRKSLVRSLSEIMISPLSIFAHPWMIVVWGVLAGALVIVPLLVGVLYRLRVAGLFILAVVVFAHAPLLAVALGAGSILAARTRLRSDLPFLAMLAGLAPVAAYLAVFSFGGDHILTPLQRTAILLPYALALAVALLGGGIVLALARVTKFRPGVIWPVLLVLVIAPVWLFYRKVGPGEFDYAVIADRVASGSGVLTATSAQDFRRWIPPATTAPASGPASAPAPVKARPVPPEELGELLKLCDQFLRRHGRHSRKAAVMWLRAAILEEQVRRRGPSGGTDSAGPAELHQAMIAAWDQLAALWRFASGHARLRAAGSGGSSQRTFSRCPGLSARRPGSAQELPWLGPGDSAPDRLETRLHSPGSFSRR